MFLQVKIDVFSYFYHKHFNKFWRKKQEKRQENQTEIDVNGCYFLFG